MPFCLEVNAQQGQQVADTLELLSHRRPQRTRGRPRGLNEGVRGVQQRQTLAADQARPSDVTGDNPQKMPAHPRTGQQVVQG
eukprot:7013761-Pyramimonas_sp.AAC.1